MYRAGRRRTSLCPECGKPKSPNFLTCYDCSQFSPETSQSWDARDSLTSEFYVYILQLDDGELYVGQTRDLEKRLVEHHNGVSASTRNKHPQLIWFNMVDTREQATNLELQLKNTNREVLLNMVENFNKAMMGEGEASVGPIIRSNLDRFGDQINDLSSQTETLTGMVRRELPELKRLAQNAGGGFWLVIIPTLLMVVLLFMQCSLMSRIENL